MTKNSKTATAFLENKEITEHNRGGGGVMASDARYRNFYESSRDAVMTLEPPSWRFTTGNPAAIEMFKAKNEDEFVSCEPWKLSPERQPDGRASDEKAKEMIEKAMREGSNFFEWTHKRISGEEFPATVLLSRVEQDEKAFLLATVRDITERKNKEELILSLNEQQQVILDASPTMIFYKDKENRNIRVNEAFAKANGLSKKEMEGKTMWDLYPQEAADHYWQDDKKVMTSGKPALNIVEEMKTPKGVLWVQTDKIPYRNSKGEIIGIIGFTTDITERKKAEDALRESEKKYRQLVETLQEGIWLIDKDSNTTFVNPRMAKTLGYSVEEMLGKTLFNFMDERGVKIAKRNVERRKQGIVEQHDFEFIRKDGSRIYAIVATTPVTDEKGNYVGALAGVNDITERKLAQEKLLASEKLAVMGRLVADVSHEANNPLTIIIGGTQLVLSRLDKKSAPFKKQLETVLRNAKRCKNIFANLLGYNRTIGKQEETVNLPALIREAIEGVGYQYDMSGIETVFNEIANAEITGNSTALLSVFVNLIRNARQAMGEKGHLTITMQKEDEKHLRIEIHDTGSGMNAKQKAELFKPFASGWKERDGSGLGLATSLGIIETHGGSMSAESGGVGKGATFTILLPCEFKEKKG